MNVEVEEITKDVHKASVDMIEDTGHIQPMFLLIKMDEDQPKMIAFPLTLKDKDYEVSLIRRAINQLDPDFVFFSSEAWILRTESEYEYDSSRSLEFVPGRKEIVMTIGHSPYGEKSICNSEIIRQGETIQVVEIKDTKGITGLTGRFVIEAWRVAH